MAQLSAERFNFTGDVVPIKPVENDETAPKTEDFIIPSSDFVVDLPETGPVDLANIGRPLLERQAQGVAAVAVSNIIEFPDQLRKFEHNVETAVEDGVLDLAAKYPDETPEARVTLFAKAVVKEQLVESNDTILANAGAMTPAEREELHKAELKTLKDEVKDKNRLLIREKATMLEILRVARASDASEELVEQIEMLAGLTPAPRVAELLEAQAKEAVAESEAKPVSKTKEFFRKALSGTALKMSGARQPRIIVK